MTINNITGKRVAVSAHTITIKNTEGKTSGMVRGVDNLSAIQPSKQFTYAQELAKSGVPREVYMRYLDRILIVDGDLYFLVDDYCFSVAERLGERIVQDVATLAKGMTIIHCERIQWSTTRR